jgi:hypothetical protein
MMEPPREWISTSYPRTTFHERQFYLGEKLEVQPSFCG